MLDKTTEDPEEVKEKPRKQTKRTVTFIIPFATPGSGKSFCWDQISNYSTTQDNWSFESISSDDVRGELIK